MNFAVYIASTGVTCPLPFRVYAPLVILSSYITLFFFKTQVTAAVSGTHLENAKNISTAKRYLVASLIVLPILSPVVVYVVYLVVATIYVFASLAQQ